MGFRLSALPRDRFKGLFGRDEAALRDLGVEAHVADAKPGFPCRVSLRDAEPGERVLLLNYQHQAADTPYRSAHAIFVIDGAEQAEPAPGEIPEELASRLLSVRAFSPEGRILNADVVDGRAAGPVFERLLAGDRVAYLHAHYAKFGCYAARVDRA